MSSTPPHLPTYNVRLSDERIKAIANAVFPSYTVAQIKQLESGKSYNNRIYFVDISQGDEERSLVLKLAGHFFDFRKIENELGCLLLFKKYCPNLPVPEPFAWSAHGDKIETLDGRTIEAEPGRPFSDHAWILTSRVPGRVLTVADLDSIHGSSILKHLGSYMAMWTTQIPKSSVWGNLRMQDKQASEEDTTIFEDLLPGKTFELGRVLIHAFDWPNTQPYYPMLAKDQLGRLDIEPQFASIQPARAEAWKAWAETELPYYPICQQDHHNLTHFDFSPRNVLVSNVDGVLKVTAILDFEFTGFFPPEEEFLNAMIRQEGDWEQRHWDIIMQEMARLGLQVPPTAGVDKDSCIDETRWKQARIIVKTVDQIAPWEVGVGKFEGEDLRRELDEAAGVVQEGLKKLRAMNTGS